MGAEPRSQASAHTSKYMSISSRMKKLRKGRRPGFASGQRPAWEPLNSAKLPVKVWEAC